MSSVPASRNETSVTAHSDAAEALGSALEIALDGVAFLFLPVLTMLALGAAPLAVVAGICAAALAVLRRAELRPLYVPAGLLAGLVGWGALSALWSINPARSLDVAARLSGMYLCGLALVAASTVLARPHRLLLSAVVGGLAAIVLAAIDLATNSGLSGLLHTRWVNTVSLNRLAVAFAILLPSAVVTAGLLRRRGVAAGVAGAMTATVYALVAMIAKFMLPVGVAVSAVLLIGRRRAIAVAAALTALLVLTAPLIFPHLAELPGVLTRADEVKVSAWHRLEIWNFVGQRIAEKPVLGWGLDASRAIPGGKIAARPGQDWLPLHPHNASLQVWLELGLPGAMLVAIFAGWLWLRLGPSAAPPLFRAAAGGSLAGAIIAACGSYDFWHEWWIGMLSLILFLLCTMGRVCREAASEPLAEVKPTLP